RDPFGKLFGDKNYLSQTLFEQIFDRGVAITAVRKNMQTRLIPLSDKLLFRQRSINTTIHNLSRQLRDQLLPKLEDLVVNRVILTIIDLALPVEELVHTPHAFFPRDLIQVA